MSKTNRNRPIFKEDKSRDDNGLFSILPIIPQLIIIALVFAAFVYINLHDFFPEWIKYIYYGAKIIIAFQFIIAAAKSLMGPIVAIALGALNLYLFQIKGLEYISPNDAWQLIILGGICVAITFLVRLVRR